MKLKHFPLILLCLFTVNFIACEDDDDDNPAPTTNNGSNNGGNNGGNSFNGISFTLNSGLVEDYGPAAGYDQNVLSHYNYDFSVVDGTFKLLVDGNNEQYYFPDSSKIYCYAELMSPDTSSFMTGTFNYVADSDRTQSNTDGKYFFSYAAIVTDSDGFDTSANEETFDAVGGTVTVEALSGTNNYRIRYDLQLEGGKTFTKEFSGTFAYSDEK